MPTAGGEVELVSVPPVAARQDEEGNDDDRSDDNRRARQRLHMPGELPAARHWWWVAKR
jgi:hypothetical protein